MLFAEPIKLTMPVRRLLADIIEVEAVNRLRRPHDEYSRDDSPYSCDAIWAAISSYEMHPRSYCANAMTEVFEFAYEELCDYEYPMRRLGVIDDGQTDETYAIRLMWMAWMITLLRDSTFQFEN